MARRYIGIGAVLALVLIGAWCWQRWEPKAQATAPLQIAQFGGVSLKLELATTSAERELGLGGRADVPDGYGMLFVFPKDDYYGFWMKNTLVPLDMFWLDAKGQVAYYLEDVQPSTYPDVFYPPVPARYVLETRAGFGKAHAIATGTPLVLKNLPTVLQ